MAQGPGGGRVVTHAPGAPRMQKAAVQLPTARGPSSTAVPSGTLSPALPHAAGPGQQDPAQGRSRRPTQQPAALTWDTGSLCVSSVRPVRQSNGSSGRLMSHTSTSPLYSPPAGPSRPGQELMHAQQPGFLARQPPLPAPDPECRATSPKTILRRESPGPQASHSPAVPHPRKRLLPPG